ncbi:Mu-like prophage major head subunit gpT family protein [Photobacterium atrarenae]|uniref:Mu-like prophage major head subunit gpT family protein n=1 Tax=Photobacterium atrarenae TaxID=865757 RepID=A0ABY5GM01_9GAMM|nr:Mu-like prophage major head subunit gpT family protein [Photobacterium atrarenae]UTV30166.1 Mu-like prophage major head subunit gpT family protein [Photobacterium atrarenae]
MDINQQNLSALYTAVKTSFNDGRGTYTPLWSKFATLVPSTTSKTSYTWLGQFPKLREWIGDRQVKKLSTHDYTLKNRKFESTVGIPAEAIEDDEYGVYMPLYQEMGYASATHPDEMLFALMAAGFSTKCYDGQYFFDTDHPVRDPETGDDGSVSNMQAGSSPAWFLFDTRRPLKPFIYQKRKDYNIKAKTDAGQSDHVFMADEYLYGVDGRGEWGVAFWQQAFASKATLNDTNFDAAIAAMMSLKSDEGRPLGISPSVLVCGPSNRSAAKKVLEAENKAQGESNTNYKAVELVVVPWLP